MGGVIMMVLILLGASLFWGALTSECNERRSRMAAMCACVCVMAFCIWHTSK